MPLRAPACVVIPCYRTSLLPYERIALERCVEVLAAHPKMLVTPHSLDVGALQRDYGLQVETFADEHFASIAGYNRLMLSDEFYARFAHCEFMLIYQFDCFVFSDQLLSWCKRGYDYVGAPWLPEGPAPTGLADLRSTLGRAYARLRNRNFPQQYFYSVGNGGFSLRRVSAMRRALRTLAKQADEYRRQNTPICNEDIFFSIEANRLLQHVATPDYRTACGFSWELQPREAARINGGQLPFGCHGWNKLHRDEWRPIFAREGLVLDEVLGEPS